MKIGDIEKDLASTAESLRHICTVLDDMGDASINKWDCCSDPSNFQTRCLRRSFNVQIPSPITKNTPGFCATTDPFCSLDDGM